MPKRLSTSASSAENRVEILYGKPPERPVSSDLRSLVAASAAATHAIFMAAWNGPDEQSACDQLIELTAAACANIELLWKHRDKRKLVQLSALKRDFFPVLHTNRTMSSGKLYPGDDMQKELILRPALISRKGKRGKPAAQTRLYDELWRFVEGVMHPGSLRWKTASSDVEFDIVDDATRRRLLGEGANSMKAWRDAFSEYVLKLRPDLLVIQRGSNPKAPHEIQMSGAFTEIVEPFWKERNKKNPDEKNPKNAFRLIIAMELRKFIPPKKT